MGATQLVVIKPFVLCVSIHAPVMGATTKPTGTPRLQHCFNPRARDGRDPRSPTRPNMPAGFNPRARDGRDHGASCTA